MRHEWNPTAEILRLQQRLERLSRILEAGMFPNLSHLDEHPGDAWKPPADILEDQDSVLLLLEVPGMKESEITLSVERNVLTVTGERKSPEPRQDARFYQMERQFGSFRRRFELSYELNQEEITARLLDGVLEIRIPKNHERQVHTIEVK